jgi:predicted DNA-binding transcriptional regulator AlpA
MSNKLSRSKSFTPSRWISQSEAARARGISRQAIFDLIKRGRLTTLVIAGKTLVLRSEIEKFKPFDPGPKPKRKRAKKK